MQEGSEYGTIKSLIGDGGYDKHHVYKRLYQLGIHPIIPPKRNGIVSKSRQSYELSRDAAVRRISEVGRTKWKEEVGYHRRSLVATSVYRYKTIIGPCLQSRSFKNQVVETKLSCIILNKMLALTKPINTEAA